MNFTYKQPYVTWKGPSTGSAVPTWSRPLINNNSNTNTGTSFAARPIKHWRKQLVPAANTGSGGRAGVGMPMDTPGGSVSLGATVDCSNCPVNLLELIPTTKNNVFDTTKDPSGNCVACNPETNVIKSVVTLLNNNYIDTKAYLQSRCQTYDQKLSTIPIPGNSYINSITHQPIPPSDSPTGSQVYYTDNCSKKCATVNSVVRTIYKPNNQQYSQQGSVSSSSRLTRLKNNTITKNGNTFKTAWGQQGANAGRYQGTSDSTYFLKTKIQECVPFHRDGNKTRNCAVPVPLPICGTIIDISTIATNTGGNNWSIVENKTIELCQILNIDIGITLTLNTGVILTVLGLINNIGTVITNNAGSGIINDGIINNQDNGIIHIIAAFLSGIENNSIINNNDGGTIIIDGEINNKSGGEINNKSGGEINNNGPKFNNFGGLINNKNGGIFNNQNGGIIYNENNGKIYNSGQIYNKDVNSMIQNKTGGVINNNLNGLIYNQDGGIIENGNGGLINNQNGGIIYNENNGIINNNTGGVINNNFGGIFNNIFGSTINNNTGGVINNNGTLYNPSLIPPKPCGVGIINGPAIGPTPITDACP